MNLSNNKVTKPWEELEEEYQQSIVKTLPEDETSIFTKDYNKINWGNYFYLDETSPSGLRWKVDTMGGRNYKTVLVKAGTSAGSLHHFPERWRVTFDKKHYMVHRIIYILLHGSIDKRLVVDHLDGDGSNNAESNLALKTPRENTQNRKMCNKNTSGVVGVNWQSRTSYSYWVARWRDNTAVKRSKSFSINNLGNEKALLLASEYRFEQMRLLNISGAAYTERHISGNGGN